MQAGQTSDFYADLEEHPSAAMDEESAAALRARIASEVDAVNDRFGLPDKWRLRAEVVIMKPDADREERGRAGVGLGLSLRTAILDNEPIVKLTWGDPKQRPNGHHAFVVYADGGGDEDETSEQHIEKTALQSALVLGRDQELHEAGLDPAKPPLWARVTTPIFARTLEAHRKIRKAKNKWLADQPVKENGAIMEPDGWYALNDRTGYTFSWWTGTQNLDLHYELPESVMTNLETMKLSDLASIQGIDLRGIDAEISANSGGGVFVSFKRDDLVRLAPSPAGIEEDPVKAWLNAAKRTTA